MSRLPGTLQEIFRRDVHAPAVPGLPLPRAATLDGGLKSAVSRALEGADATALIQLLRFDPLSTARCLRVANSPFFFLGQRVACIDDALEVLGSRTLAMIALASSFDYGLGRKWSGQLDGLRRHSIQIATLAQQIAYSAGRPWQAEDAFIAGLLHDIHPMLHYRDHLVEGRVGDGALRSAGLLRGWNLPVRIIEAIDELGNAPDQPSSPQALGSVLRIAHALAPGFDHGAAVLIEQLRPLANALQLPADVMADAFSTASARLDAMGLAA